MCFVVTPFYILFTVSVIFLFHLQALGVPYHMTETFLGMGGSIVAGRFCGHTMLQYADDDNDENAPPLFVHANLMKITDKNHFMEQAEDGQTVERPWHEIKRYRPSRNAVWLQPQFYIAPGGRACMDFLSNEGEPESVVENFDDKLQAYQSLYFQEGGIGGETRY